MTQSVHPPVEEYLEAIHELLEEGSQVIQARLVERLHHPAPTVSERVRRLKDDLRKIRGGFPERRVEQIDVKDLPADQPELAHALPEEISTSDPPVSIGRVSLSYE